MTEQAAEQDGARIALEELRRGIQESIVRQREQLAAYEHLEEESRSQSADLFLEVLEIIDKLDIWLGDPCAQAAIVGEAPALWVNRLRIVQSLLTKMLGKYEVIPYDPVLPAPEGSLTILDRVVRPDIDQKTIDKVVEKGWKWRTEVLRTATVIIAIPDQ